MLRLALRPAVDRRLALAATIVALLPPANRSAARGTLTRDAFLGLFVSAQLAGVPNLRRGTLAVDAGGARRRFSLAQALHERRQLRVSTLLPVASEDEVLVVSAEKSSASTCSS